MYTCVGGCGVSQNIASYSINSIAIARRPCTAAPADDDKDDDDDDDDDDDAGAALVANGGTQERYKDHYSVITVARSTTMALRNLHDNTTKIKMTQRGTTEAVCKWWQQTRFAVEAMKNLPLPIISVVAHPGRIIPLTSLALYSTGFEDRSWAGLACSKICLDMPPSYISGSCRVPPMGPRNHSRHQFTKFRETGTDRS